MPVLHVVEKPTHSFSANMIKPHDPAHEISGGAVSPLLIDLFCGSAGVCAHFRLAGGRALGIDHNLNRSKLKAAAAKLDLNEQWVRKLSNVLL